MFKATIEVPVQKVQDNLCSAFEGGSNYWYTITEFVKPTSMPHRSDEEGKVVYKHLDYPVNPGGALMIGDAEDPARKPVRLDVAAIQKGLDVMAEKFPRHFSNMMDENGDAITGDVLLQCCVFGDVIYG